MTANNKTSNREAIFNAFPPGALKFLAALAKNNNREWFQPRKHEFEDLLHTPLVQLATLVNGMLETTAPDYTVLQPAKALNRIYRDIRFSADKTPYQTHVSMLFPDRRLSKKVGAALYFSLSATELMVAAGMYFGETRQLQAVREHIATHHAAFRAILAAKPLKQRFGDLQGECLQKAPKQFGVDHPAADLLKRKQWLLMSTQPAKEALSDSFASDVIKGFRLLLPFVAFINDPLKKLPQRAVSSETEF
jgi:uncharacterized protein (TIGR02453 family)